MVLVIQWELLGLEHWPQIFLVEFDAFGNNAALGPAHEDVSGPDALHDLRDGFSQYVAKGDMNECARANASIGQNINLLSSGGAFITVGIDGEIGGNIGQLEILPDLPQFLLSEEHVVIAREFASQRRIIDVHLDIVL